MLFMVLSPFIYVSFSSSFSSPLEYVIHNQDEDVKLFLAFFASPHHYFFMSKPLKKSAHGGKRSGAGRKPIDGETVMIAARISTELRDKLDRFAKSKGLSRSQAIAEAIRQLR
jgi:hypothetical protein